MSQFVRSGQNIGPYKITSRIAEGSFSTAWKTKPLQGDPVIVQVIENSALRQELQERPIIPPKFVIPNVAKLFAVYSSPLAFVWKALPGRKLSDYVEQLGKIKPNIAIYIARKILEILQALDQRQQFHGGLRPQRIFITPDKKVVMSGFPLGQSEQRLLAKMYNQGDNLDYLSHLLPYFAPEVLEQCMLGNIQSDIYSVGMMLAFMLTGKIDTGKELLSILHTNKCDPNIISIILKATTSISDRYTNPQTMAKDLTKLLTQADMVQQLYVSQIQPNAEMAMEAVPADSQEFRIMHAGVISAKQAIDADEVTAVPVDWNEDAAAKTAKFLASSLQLNTPDSDDGVRFKTHPAVLVSTIDTKILDPLEKDALWPAVLMKYMMVLAIWSLVLVLLACLPW